MKKSNAMKIRFLYILLFLSLSSFVFSQTYYWYKNQKVHLISTERKFALIEEKEAQKYLSHRQLHKVKKEYHQRETLLWGVFDNWELERLDQSSIVYTAPTYKRLINAEEVFISHLFYVKLKTINDYSLLCKFAQQNNAIIEYHSPYLPLWYVLSCAKTYKNALEMANFFYESGLFSVAEPAFWQKDDRLSAGDPLLEQQWNLNNTGQYNPVYRGIDINYDNVSTIVPQQSDIVVAVIDDGVQLDHPDLSEHIFGEGYDTFSKSSPSVIHGYHGTACAGIIGAISNNGVGVRGIFNGKLMPISNAMGSEQYMYFDRAEGIVYAADNGADVISNSWRCIDNVSVIEDAIEYAIENGRDGLGCVVVFASGNRDTSVVSYPANSDERIIVVGALSPCGERKDSMSCDGVEGWGSQYGHDLDVMAPGVFIPTTDLIGLDGYDLTDYKLDFDGTSAACPHVAAIAGLILSVNPQLTAKQVADIIESTAQKVGGYDYLPKEGRPNGTWNEEMGYGLVDAYAAVLAAQPKYIQNQTYLSGQEVYEYATEITAGYAVTNAKPYGNVVFEAGSDVTLRGMDKVVLKSGFHAKAGSKLHVKVDTPTTTQATATLQRVASKRSSSEDTDSTYEISMYNSIENIETENIISTSIYTISGQLIQTIIGGQHDVTHLPNGMYILQHRMSDGSMKSAKIINSK